MQTVKVGTETELPEELVALLEGVGDEREVGWFKTVVWKLQGLSVGQADFHLGGCTWPKAKGYKRYDPVFQYLIVVDSNAQRSYGSVTILECPLCRGRINMPHPPAHSWHW